MFVKAIVLIVCLGVANSLNNGLAKTPPMGWLSWERFACNIDCVNYPNECINEQLYKDMADRMAADGYKDAGYKYVNVDDCWSEMARDATTKRLVADHKRFPSGMKALGDYIHSKGLLFGIYGDVGSKTCGGYPGQRDVDGSDYDSLDANTYAEWGVDSLKLDGCNADTKNYTNMYPEMSRALNSSGRGIVYACSWPAYQIDQNPDYQRIAEFCNYWRNFDDIMDSWSSVTSIIDFYAKYQNVLVKYHGISECLQNILIVPNFVISNRLSDRQNPSFYPSKPIIQTQRKTSAINPKPFSFMASNLKLREISLSLFKHIIQLLRKLPDLSQKFEEFLKHKEREPKVVSNV